MARMRTVSGAVGTVDDADEPLLGALLGGIGTRHDEREDVLVLCERRLTLS